jgi:hypothetical protein
MVKFESFNSQGYMIRYGSHMHRGMLQYHMFFLKYHVSFLPVKFCCPFNCVIAF